MMAYTGLIKPVLSFAFKRNPVISDSLNDYRRFVPEPYKGVVIISADFELAWAWRFSKSKNNPVASGLVLAKQERDNTPKIISLCEEFNIPVTWATVGHLFLESCNKSDSRVHNDLKRVPYFENQWWKYDSGDWFDADPCSNFNDSPHWYCPDLIRNILDSNVGHEVGCHTFSHIPCTDGICPPEVLEAELEMCALAAEPFGLHLESFVFPGHTMGNYATIRKMGYSSVRTNYINILGYPKLDENGLWWHETTMELNLNPGWPLWYNIYRYRKIINLTINNKAVCNLWFHPSMHPDNLTQLFPEVFKILNLNRDILWITTMKEYTKWLNSNAI